VIEVGHDRREAQANQAVQQTQAVRSARNPKDKALPGREKAVTFNKGGNLRENLHSFEDYSIAVAGELRRLHITSFLSSEEGRVV
jgi:hypothetical protein